MTVQTTSNLSNALRAQYLEDYVQGAKMVRLYDQLAYPVGKDMATLTEGSSVVVNFVSDLAPATSAISETTDLTPATVRDGTASITPTSRANAIQCSEKLLNQSYTPYGQERFRIIGENMMESVDLLAQAAATKGSLWSSYGNTARTSLDAGANYRLTESAFTNAQADLETMKVPQFMDAGRGVWMALMHPYAFADLRASSAILAVGEYQKANIILNFELGEFGPFKLVVSPFAKVFWGVGAANTTDVDTTIATSSTANIALAKTIEVAAAGSIAAGQWLNIVTAKESSTTHYATTERVKVASISGTTVTIVGSGPNGGLRFDHSVGDVVNHDDSVGTCVFGGPKSLAKVWDTNVGEYGETVGPKKQGLVDQFESLGWKFYGDYGRPVESWLLRYEHTFSRDE